VEIVRRTLDAVRRRDWETGESAYSPDVEWDDRDLRPEGAVHRGLEAMRAEMRPWFLTWSDYRLEIERMVDADEHVVAIVRETGKGRSSGVRLDQRIGMVFTLRDGLIRRVRLFRDREEALEAAGLSE